MSGLPEPRANPLLLGQDAAESALIEAMCGGRLAHAWLLLGPSGIGKATLAFRFARRLLAGNVAVEGLFLPPSNLTFRRVAAGSHADLLTVERAWDEKRKKVRGEIVVDDVRRIADFLRRTPAEGGWRVVVLDGAEDLNRNAANALLKVLEEPPPRAVLLLVCSAAGRLLPTIRSRCRRLRLKSLPVDDVASLLGQAMPELPAGERRRVAELSDGSIGHALDLAHEGGIGLAALVAQVLRSPADLTTAQALQTADTLGREEAVFATFFELLRAALSAAVRAMARGSADAAQARLVGHRPLAEWVTVWHALGSLQDATEGLHLDMREALVRGFRLLSGAANA